MASYLSRPSAFVASAVDEVSDRAEGVPISDVWSRDLMIVRDDVQIASSVPNRIVPSWRPALLQNETVLSDLATALTSIRVAKEASIEHGAAR
jgi:hypothetical protein